MGRTRDSRFYRVTRRLGGALGAAFLRALGVTWRIEIRGPDPFAAPGPLVCGVWHGGLLIAAVCWRDRGLVIPVSQSRDGDWIEAVLRRLGFAESARGSSSRGATALLRTLIRRVRAGETIGMLPDGPRGPSGVAKPGIIALARATSARLVPVGVAAAPVFRFASWDRARLPLPFARVRCLYGEPLPVPRDASPEALEALRLRFETELHRLDAGAESALHARRA